MYKALPDKALVLVKMAEKKPSFLTTFIGADTQIRTGDLILTNDALYRLSYISIKFGNSGILHPNRKKSKGKNKKILYTIST